MYLSFYVDIKFPTLVDLFSTNKSPLPIRQGLDGPIYFLDKQKRSFK
jgi:hypothetical protein